jgi:hypothetical protein
MKPRRVGREDVPVDAVDESAKTRGSAGVGVAVGTASST